MKAGLTAWRDTHFVRNERMVSMYGAVYFLDTRPVKWAAVRGSDSALLQNEQEAKELAAYWSNISNGPVSFYKVYPDGSKEFVCQYNGAPPLPKSPPVAGGQGKPPEQITSDSVALMALTVIAFVGVVAVLVFAAFSHR